MRNYVWILKILNSKFLITSDEKTTKIKIVDLEKLWNFIVDNFFIRVHLVM
jgi:hypothetical protein